LAFELLQKEVAETKAALEKEKAEKASREAEEKAALELARAVKEKQEHLKRVNEQLAARASKYAQQLAQIRELGFVHADVRVVELLEKFGGDVVQVVEMLIGEPAQF